MAVAETNRGIEKNRGRAATTPVEIPPRGWCDILWRVWAALGQDNVSIVAAGVAFDGMLAVFPAITSFVSIHGLLADPADVQRQFATLMHRNRAQSEEDENDISLREHEHG